MQTAFSATYGLTHRQEFVAEAFTNPVFQRRLASVDATPELLSKLGLESGRGAIGNLWQAFLHTIGKVFGIPTDAGTMSLLEATVRFGDKLGASAEGTTRDMAGLIDHGGKEPAANHTTGAGQDDQALDGIRTAIEAADRGETPERTLFQRGDPRRLPIEIPGERMFLTRDQARTMARGYSRKADELRASGADETTIAQAEQSSAAIQAALPQFDELPSVQRDPNAPAGKPFTPSKVIESGKHAVTVATDERHAPHEDVKTYRIFRKPEGGLDGVKTPSRDLGSALGYVEVRQNEDGRWEVAMVEVRPSARGQGVAKDLYAAVQQDLGITMRPSGVLLPDGYAMWSRRDPEAVKWHQEVTRGDGRSYFLSPRALAERRGAFEASDPAFDASMKAAEAALPDEAKSPEALATMFQGGSVPRGSITFRPGDRPLLRLMADADASTFVHEMGHDWLEQMMRDAAPGRT